MREPTTSSEDTVPQIQGDENPVHHDDVNPSEHVSDEEESEGEQSEGDRPEDEQSEDEQPEEEGLPEDELSDEGALVAEPPRANAFSAVSAGGFTHRIPVGLSITDNPSRGSRINPQPKHLRIRLPDALAQLFSGVWVAKKGEDVFVDLLARSDQTDRSGYKTGDLWKWIKIKPNAEFAVAISRGYTKSRCDAELVRDYRIGAYKICVPFDADDETPERGTDDRRPRPMFD